MEKPVRKEGCLYLLATKAYLSEDGKDFYLTNVVKITPLRRFPGGSKVIAKCQHWNVTDVNLNNSTLQYLKPAHLLRIWIQWNIARFALTLKNLETDNKHSIYFETLITMGLLVYLGFNVRSGSLFKRRRNYDMHGVFTLLVVYCIQVLKSGMDIDSPLFAFV